MNNRILQSLSYGLYAVGVKGEKYPTACIVNTVFQITSSPMMVAISINHANYTNECIKRVRTRFAAVINTVFRKRLGKQVKFQASTKF